MPGFITLSSGLTGVGSPDKKPSPSQSVKAELGSGSTTLAVPSSSLDKCKELDSSSLTVDYQHSSHHNVNLKETNLMVESTQSKWALKRIIDATRLELE